MTRQLLLPASIALSIISTPACQLQGGDAADEPDEQARLEALLFDAPVAFRPDASAARVAETAEPTSQLAPRDVVGEWSFDDCNSADTHLRDVFGRATSFRSVGVRCSDGVIGSPGIAIAAPEDIAYLPDQPFYTFEAGVTLSGWFKPAVITGTRTLFRKRDKGTSSFALLLNAGKYELVIGFGPGRAISLTSPSRAKTGVFQHVAATYDGSTARLYVDGAEVNHFDVPGTIPVGPGPLLMGNDGSERRFDGSIDNVVFATHALTSAQIAQLLCVTREPLLVVSPEVIPPTPVGTAVSLDVALTNRSGAVCPALTFNLQVFALSTGLQLDPASASSEVASGATGHFTVTAVPRQPGDTQFFLFASEPTGAFSFLRQLFFEATEPE